ncbi:hypothetical protein ID866_7425 [Astraeus odoratus]|nr:hypothetical protein ID866_7425 [Astraeus odoratus]
MDDIDEFFSEQERRMNVPDEDMDAYIRSRLEGLHRKRDEGWTSAGSLVDGNAMRLLAKPDYHQVSSVTPAFDLMGQDVLHVTTTTTSKSPYNTPKERAIKTIVRQSPFKNFNNFSCFSVHVTYTTKLKVWKQFLPPELDDNWSSITSPGISLVHEACSKGEVLGVSGGKPSLSSIPIRADAKLRRTVNSGRKARPTSVAAKDKKRKEKPRLVTPLEYAQKLQSSVDNLIIPKTSYLKGKHIFYVGGDWQYASRTTRGRMEYIVKHGGTLVPKYDPNIVTHIVTEAGRQSTVRALSLKSLSEIPDHIPTVTWSWVLSDYGRTTGGRGNPNQGTRGKGKARDIDDRDEEASFLDLEFLHAAFPERIDAGKRNKLLVRTDDSEGSSEHGTSGKPPPCTGLSVDTNGDFSGISDFTQEKREETCAFGFSDAVKVPPPPPLNLWLSEGPSRIKSLQLEKYGVRWTRQSSSDATDDPLAEYYAQAKAERDAVWKLEESDSDDDGRSVDFSKGAAQRRGFACDDKEPRQTISVNQDIITKLEELMELHRAKPSDHDRWRVFSYGKCIRALRNYPKRITSFSEARSIRGVGEKTALKIMEIINTGNLRRIEYERTDDVKVTRLFQGVYGVGRATAFMWYASGCRTLEDISARKESLQLSPAQEIGLRYYDDINSRMPREEAERIFNMIKSIGTSVSVLRAVGADGSVALDIDDNLFIEIMGSFRRGKADCGDIDILITRPISDGKTHAGVFAKFLALERNVGELIFFAYPGKAEEQHYFTTQAMIL